MTRHIARWASAAALSLLTAGAAWATPISSSLSIIGSVSLDTLNSSTASNGASQGGTLRAVSGGVSSTADFTDLTFSSGSSPLTRNLTDLQDGIGARHAASGTDNGTAGLLGINYSVSLNNSSATETFVINFLAEIINAVTATGSDAFATSKISILDPTSTEVVFSDHRVDTANTGPSNNFALGSASNAFSITLAPGASATFTAAQDVEGGVFAPGQFSADMTAFLKINSITSRGGPTNNVPLPGSLPLVALGLAALLAARRGTAKA